jgi:programmed cell death protein 5
VNRVALVKPENARAVEDHIIRLARAGKLPPGAKVDEGMVMKLLEEVNSAFAAAAAQGVGGGSVVMPAKKVIIQRKRRDDDSDDDDDDF